MICRIMWCPSPWYAWDIIRKAISGSTETVDQKYVVFEEKYREFSDEELKEMFAERAAGFVKTPTSSAENFAQAFYRRKTGAAFSKEMKRSVRAMLADYTKESC